MLRRSKSSRINGLRGDPAAADRAEPDLICVTLENNLTGKEINKCARRESYHGLCPVYRAKGEKALEILTKILTEKDK